MKGNLEIWRIAADRLQNCGTAILLVVAESAGSSPGRSGFKMIVTENEIAGSIGGGVMEVSLVGKARELLKSKIANRKSQIAEMVHQENAANSSGMICSGRQTIILFRLDETDSGTVENIISQLEDTRTCRLQITDYKLQISESRTDRKSLKNEVDFAKASAGGFLYEEMLGLKPRLFIVGGGHCALALSELASKLGFSISLFDDREGLNTIEKNIFADEISIVESYEEVGEHIPDDENAFVVVMTLGFKFDEIVVRALFEKNFRYFGVLGSKAKIKTMFAALRKEGFDKSRLEKIRAPIGVPINSRSPEEIAVSIAAELIAVKNAV